MLLKHVFMFVLKWRAIGDINRLKFFSNRIDIKQAQIFQINHYTISVLEQSVQQSCLILYLLIHLLTGDN